MENYIEKLDELIALKKNDEVFDALDAMKRTGRGTKYTQERIKMVEKLGLKRSKTNGNPSK